MELRTVRHLFKFSLCEGNSVMMRSKSIYALSVMTLTVFWIVSRAVSEPVPDNTIWPRAFVLPKPKSMAGVRQPVVSLRGQWYLNLAPPSEFWTNSVDPASWDTVQVPMDLQTQNISITRGNEYAYKQKIKVPAEFAGKRVLLRFEGVTGQTRVWVNGTHIRDHFGGFTAWNCEITDQVSAGSDAWVTLGVTDTKEGISTFNVGGILRDIKMIAVPYNYVSRFNVETNLDKSYKDAVLRVWAAIDFHSNLPVRIAFVLKNPQGQPISLSPASVDLRTGNNEAILAIPIRSPVKWDAEHPNLYTLEGHLYSGKTQLEVVSRQIGFRKIERMGRIVLVNGNEVKLRGVNHHDIGPNGRSITPETAEQDVKLFRDANINYVRTSHYPPMEEFLDACDRYGMYVGDESSVAFVDKDVANKSTLKPLFLNQLAEQIERDRSHPSVLIWDLANESSWGSNMQAEFDFVRQEDPTRLTTFSFGDRAPAGEAAPYLVYSLHYASYSRDLAGGGPHGPGDKETDGASRHQHIPQPVLHDEWAHVPVHDRDRLKLDPGMRNFYGESISRFWAGLFPAEGALGGAIWAGLDEFWPARGSTEWGLLDVWRRTKPEYWNVKKAYSPIRLDEMALPLPETGKRIQIPIKNWFDHTNLSEVRVAWSTLGDSGVLNGPDVKPHSAGLLTLPSRASRSGSSVNLKFYRLDNLLVDEYNLPTAHAPRQLVDARGPAPKIIQGDESIAVLGKDFSLTFSKLTGLITRGEYKGVSLIESGPYLQLTGGRALPPWSLKRIDVTTEGKEAVVTLSGGYGETMVTFVLRIDGTGLVQTKYTLDALPDLDRKLVQGHSFSRDVGGYFEVGIAYELSPDVDSFTWFRKGLWSAYPADHIGRIAGVASRYGNDISSHYLDRPNWPWANDEKDFLLFGKYDIGGHGTNDFRSLKENIYSASANFRGAPYRVQAESQGTEAVRLQVMDDPRSLVDPRGGTVKLSGSWLPTDTGVRSASPGDSAEFTFTGTTICWFGPRDPSGGTADVYIDGKLEASALSLYARAQQGDQLSVDMSHELLFSKEGLTNGSHTIKIIVLEGTKPDADQFVTVDSFKVLKPQTRGQVRFIVDNLWNYPRLSWGNYVNGPILVNAGYSNNVRIRLSDRDESHP